MIDELLALDDVEADDIVAPAPAQYTHDLWPIGLKLGQQATDAIVVRPRDTEAVAAIVRWAGNRRVRIAPFGGGSNVVGALDSEAAVILSLERLSGVRDLDRVSQVVTVGAGTIGGELERALSDEGFTLGHYPQSLDISTVGGWVATRASGTYSTRFGGVERMIVGATVVLPDGEVVSVAPRARAAGGLDLLALLCGAEGTLGVVTEVSLAIQRRLPEQIVCAAFDSFADGVELQRALIQEGFRVGLLRLFNAAESEEVMRASLHSEGACLALFSAHGPDQELAAREAAAARALVERLGGSILPAEAADGWFARRYRARGLMEEGNAEIGRVFDTIEVTLPWRTAAACAAELERELQPFSDPLYLHFSHGYLTGACLYMMLHVTAVDDEAAIAATRDAWRHALAIVAKHAGAFGHHHGVGQVRAAHYAASADGVVHARIRDALDERRVLSSSMFNVAADPV